MEVVFTEGAFEDYNYWQDNDNKVFERIKRLILNIKENPFKYALITLLLLVFISLATKQNSRELEIDKNLNIENGLHATIEEIMIITIINLIQILIHLVQIPNYAATLSVPVP